MARFNLLRLALVTLVSAACSSGAGTSAGLSADPTASASDTTAGASETGVVTGATGASVGMTGTTGVSVGTTGATGASDETGATGTTAPEVTTGEPATTGVVVDEHAPRGFIDHVDCDGVWGWTIDDDEPLISLTVKLDFGGVLVMATADQPRPDVCMSEPCDHGFGVAVPIEAQDGNERAVTVFALDAESSEETMIGGGKVKCGGAQEDPFTVLYEQGDSVVRYRPVADVFEKTDKLVRDPARKMMPIDLHTWSIANFNRDLLMLSRFRLMDKGGYTLFEYKDTIGAVHVALAQTPEETARGNNHQPALSEFLIAEGDYQVEYTLLPNSAGHPSLMLWRQRENNLFLLLVGAAVNGVEQGSVDADDGILVDFNETVTRSFTVQFLDEDNAIYKSNANGFEN